MKEGDRVTSPAGHPATVTKVRATDSMVWVKFDDPNRVPGGFPAWRLKPLTG